MELLDVFFDKLRAININEMGDGELIGLLISSLSFIVALFSTLVALIVLFYAAYQYWLKRGLGFRGLFVISQSDWSAQAYVGEVIVENTKDKAVAISGIYLRIDRNIFLELTDYSDSPRIISPFETIKISFNEGVSGYIASTNRVDVGSLLLERKIPKSLMVSTPQGITVVKKYKAYWNVYFESLRNNFIIPVRAVRKWRNGKPYSDKLKFVVKECRSVGQVREHYLYSGHWYSIKGLSINPDDFETASDLEIYLGVPISSVVTFSVEEVPYEYPDFKKYPEVQLPHHGFFATYVRGKLYTSFHRWSLKLKRSRRTK